MVKAKKEKRGKKVATADGNPTRNESDEDEETVFAMKNFVNLGGEKDDYKLLKDVGDEEEELDIDDSGADSSLQCSEIADFIKTLGFDKHDDGSKEKETIRKKDTNNKEPKKAKIKLLDVEGPSKIKKESKKSKTNSSDVEKTMSKNDNKSKKAKTKTSDNEENTSENIISKKSKKNKYKSDTTSKMSSADLQHAEVSSTTRDAEVDLTSVTRKLALFKPGAKWFEYEFINDPTSFEAVSVTQLKSLERFAATEYTKEVASYKKDQEKQNQSDSKWMKTVLVSGTLSDKMAALTLLVQESAIHCLSSLDNLISMVKKKNKRESLMSLDTLKQLFADDLLLDGRKLKTFEQHPHSLLDELSSGNRDSRDKRLLLWYFEAQLKVKYSTFVETLEVMAKDNIAAAKQKAISTVYDLLASKPENEKALLKLLCNKVGDPDFKIASKAAHLLTRLVERHPAMKVVVVSEVEQFLYRPNMAAKAQYYGVCFMNQLVLSHEETLLAAKLINIYFSFFKSYVKKGDVDAKMMSALLSGVNRAFPYAKVEKDQISAQIETLYKLVHIVKFNTAIQALMLLQQVSDHSEGMSDRYYQALYRKLLDPELKASSKHPMFLNLLYKSMKKDMVDKRVKAFIKRLLQVCSQQSPPFICAALILLSEVVKNRPGLLSWSQANLDIEDDNDDEHFVDVEEDEEVEDGKGSNKKVNEDAQKNEVKQILSHKGHTTAHSWLHRTNTRSGSDTGNYDPHHRNPLYCHADIELVWELEGLREHYHPSVALFANTLLNGEAVQYPGDPLADFTLIRFLDRFVYRNPKKKDGREMSTSKAFQSKVLLPAGARAVPVNSEEFLQHAETSIPIDEKFFFKFFSQKAAKKAEAESDDESVEDQDFDDFLDNYEKKLEEKEFDFAGDFSKKKTTKGKKQDSDEEEDDDLDMGSDFDNLSDEEVDFGEDLDSEFDEDESDSDADSSLDGDSAQEDDDLDEEDVSFSDDDEFGEINVSNAKSQKGKKRTLDLNDITFPQKSSKKNKRDENLFAAAEEFAHMMDETGEKADQTGAEAVSNTDNASAKQLQWESKREKWVQGTDWKSRKRPQFRGKSGQKGKGNVKKITGRNRKPNK